MLVTDGLILWGRKTSANVQKPLWLLEEIGVPFSRRNVGGRFGGLDTPKFGHLNPNRLVPVLQHGNVKIWESHAIVRYLAATYSNGDIWPTDSRTRAAVDQWADWTATTFQPAWIDVFWQLVRTPKSKRDAAAIEAAVKQTNRCFAIMNDALGEHAWLAGDRLTYADIVAGVSLYRWFSMDVEREPFAHVQAWYERLSERPAFQRGVMIDYSELIARETA